MPADPQLHQSDIAPPPPSSSYKDKYIHGLEERIWLYKALVQKDAAIKGQITLLHEALIRATATETRRSEKLSQAVEREAKKRRVDPAISDKCSVDETPASTPDAASRSASAKVQSTRSEMREPAKQTPKTPLPLYPPGVTADTLPKAPLSSSSKDRHRSGSADNHGSAAPISRGPPSSVKKLKKKSDMRKAKDADCIPTDKVKVQPKLPKPVSVAIPKPKKKVAAAPLTTPKNLSSSAPKSKADEDAAPSAKPAKKAKSTPKNTWEFPEYIKSMVLPEVEERDLPQVVINPDNFVSMTRELKKSMVAWTDIIRSTHPGSLSHLRHLERVRIELAVHDFLSQKLFWKDIQHCVAAQATGNRTDKLYIAIPEEWADRFADWFSDRIDKGLLDKLSKPKPRRHSAPLHLMDSQYKEFPSDEDTPLSARLSHSSKRSWLEMVRVHIPNFKDAPMHRDFISDYFARNGLPLEVVTADLEEDAGYGVPLDQEEAFYEEFIEFFHYQDRRAPPREGKRPVGSGKRPKKTVPPTGQQQAVPLEPVKTNPAPFKREIQHIVVDGAYFFKWSEVIEARYGTEYQALVTSFDLSPRIQLGIIAFLDKSLAATGFSTEDCLVTFTDGEKTYGIPWMIKDEFEDWFARNAKDQFLQYVMNDFGSSSEDEAADEDVDSTGKGDEEDELMSPPRRGGLRTVIDEDTEEDEEDEATVDMEMEPFKIPVPKETPVDVSNAVTTTPEENAMTMQSLFGESGPQEPLSYVASAAATEDEASALSMNFQMPQLWPTQQCQQQSPATGQVAFEFPITSMAELPVSGPSQEQQQQQYQETTDPVEIMRVFTSNPEDSGCENLCMAMKAGEEQASSTVMAQDPHQSFSEKEAPMSKAEQNAMEHVRTELSSARNSLESLTTLLNAPVVVPLPLSKKEDQEQKNPRTLLDIETEAGENSSL